MTFSRQLQQYYDLQRLPVCTHGLQDCLTCQTGTFTHQPKPGRKKAA